MRENVVKNKSFDFSVQIVEHYKLLVSERKEFVMAKQMLRSGTAVGALIREAEHAESKPDFVHKLAIAQKEMNETLYWLELLLKTKYLKEHEFLRLNDIGEELIKLLTSIIKTSKANIRKK